MPILGIGVFCILDSVVQLGEANEITRKILNRQPVTDEEFRYVLMFNLTAMTQILWELSGFDPERARSILGEMRSRSGSGSGLGSVKGKIAKLVSLTALAAFLAGLGLGYILP